MKSAVAHAAGMQLVFAFAGLLLSGGLAQTAFADRYVAQAGQTPSGGYTTWATAARNIQDAVDVADAGENVWVAASDYTNSVSQVVYITNSVRLRGWPDDGRDNVVINGNTLCRGIVVSNVAAYVLIEGMTIKNGYTINTRGGAGVYICSLSINSGTTVVDNCVITENYSTNRSGAGLAARGQDANTDYYVEISDCEISNNTNINTGVGAFINYGRALVRNSRISTNMSPEEGNSGAGMYLVNTRPGTVISNCLFEANAIKYWGGGLKISADDVTVENCTFRHNTALGGGGIMAEGNRNIMRSCLIYANEAVLGGGLRITAGSSQLIENCTIVNNNASNSGGGINNKDQDTVIRNTIVYNNSAPSYADYYNEAGTSYWSYSCMTPLPAGDDYIDGGGNITHAAPGFVDSAGQNYRLASDSPCINTGTNQSWMTNAVDLDGRKRMRYGRVDMGAYETVYEGTIYKTR